MPARFLAYPPLAAAVAATGCGRSESGPYLHDRALAVVEAMVKPNSVDPARFGPAKK